MGEIKTVKETALMLWDMLSRGHYGPARTDIYVRTALTEEKKPAKPAYLPHEHTHAQNQRKQTKASIF